MIYLASPYSHDNASVRVGRFKAVCRHAARLMSEGQVVFSPIAHTHPLSVYGNLPTDWKFWEKYDTEIIRLCEKVVVLKLKGWEKSVGVQAEIRIAERLEIPVEYINV